MTRSERVARFFIVPCLVTGLLVLLSGSDRPVRVAADTAVPQAPVALSGKQPGLPSAMGHLPPRKAGLGVRPGPPTMLRLPALGVTATVVPVLSSNQALVPPSDYTAVGWWEDGAAPGSPTGTSVLVGHTVHTGGGALDHLGDLHPGDQVIVDRTRHDLIYRVASVRTYLKASFGVQAGRILSQSGPGRLAIVTCGDYNGAVFLTNIVVIATNPQRIS